MRFVVLLVLVGCGHTLRTGAGPLVDSDGRPGLVASFEAGTHLIGAKEAAMPIGIRTEVSATSEGVTGLVAITYGATLPPGGRRGRPAEGTTKLAGWGGRFAFAAGAVLDGSDVDFGTRFGLALTRGSISPGGREGGGCSGGHEKSAWCYSWLGWRFAHTGVELATTLRWVATDDPDDTMDLGGWRISAELVHERGTFSDLQLH